MTAADGILPLDGATPEQALAAASLVAELVRRLNHATRGATPTPPELDSIVTSVHLAVRGLPQLVTQLATIAEQYASHPLLAADDGGNPTKLAVAASQEMTIAAARLVDTETHLNRARQHTAQLYLDE